MITPLKKRILYVITKSNWGGAQRYVYDLATNLPKDEFEVAVAFGGEGKLGEMLEGAGIRTIVVNNLSRDINITDEIRVFLGLIGLFRKERPDIVHLNSPKAGGLGSLAARFTKIPVIIYTPHGWTFREERPEWQKIFIRFFSWLTVVFAHKTITISSKDFFDSPRLFVENKAVLIHNGIANSTLGDKSSARKKLLALSRFPVSKERLYLGTIAELHKNKGLSYAIDALAMIKQKIPKIVFLIIGDGEEKLRLEKQIEKGGLGDRVRLLGFVDGATKMLPALDMFILPSIKEGLPYTVLEAGQAELPVIATAVGGVPEIIDDLQTGVLVRPRSPQEIARAIEFLIQNKNKAAELGANLREKVLREFSLEKMLDKTLDLYRQN